jgi:hypothetical protein
MVIGIVGAEAAKFTPFTEMQAKAIIRALLSGPYVTGYSSGHCHLGGVDIWTEEIGNELGLKPFIYPPKTLSWADGYKPRNLQIVAASNEVHCITVEKLPVGYKGMEFDSCYHCKGRNREHCKSGGCWTAWKAAAVGKPAYWHII